MKLPLFLAALVALGGPSFAAEPAKPNVLLIILDDQNGFAGRTDLAPEPVTPNLDRLRKRGVTFANAQCAAPVCNPSRTALLSGLRPSTTGWPAPNLAGEAGGAEIVKRLAKQFHDG